MSAGGDDTQQCRVKWLKNRRHTPSQRAELRLQRWLRAEAHTTFSKEPGLVPSTHNGSQLPLIQILGYPMTRSGLWRPWTYIEHIHTFREIIHTCKIKFKNLKYVLNGYVHHFKSELLARLSSHKGLFCLTFLYTRKAGCGLRHQRQMTYHLKSLSNLLINRLSWY